jgi:uncharacterized protein
MRVAKVPASIARDADEPIVQWCWTEDPVSSGTASRGATLLQSKASPLKIMSCKESDHMIELLKKRRTQYSLGNKLPLSEAEVDGLIREVIRHTPSSFNSQSSRAVILFGEQSTSLWRLVKETLRAIVPAASFDATNAKIDRFAAGAGTVLFFEDQETIRDLKIKFPSYAEQFPVWSEQSAGMAQLAVWTALANVGIGASLQHYNPLIDASVAARWNIPESWTLRAQMPFGSNEAPFAEKTFMSDELRFKTYR